MKILVFGAGVVGTTYAWQLQEAGYDITLFVRKQRMVRYAHSGVPVNYTDLRNQAKDYGQSVFRPSVIDRLDANNPFDLIIVSVRSNQWSDALPYIAKYAGKADVLLLGNMWEEVKSARKIFPEGKCFFGFPGAVIGSPTENGINCHLFNNGHTILGEPGNKATERLKKTAEILDSAGLNPKTEKNIKDWLPTRYLISAIQPALINKAGGARLFASNKMLIRQYIIALKEGQKVCRKKGVKSVKLFPFSRFFLPGFLLTTLIRRQFSDEVVAALDNHMKHAAAEKKKQYYDVFHTGKRLRVRMPYWRSFEKYLDFS